MCQVLQRSYKPLQSGFIVFLHCNQISCRFLPKILSWFGQMGHLLTQVKMSCSQDKCLFSQVKLNYFSSYSNSQRCNIVYNTFTFKLSRFTGL